MVRSTPRNARRRASSSSTSEPISCAVNDLITVTVVQSAGGTLPLVSFNGRRASLAVTEYVGKYTTNYPILAAAGVLALIPPGLLALALNKRITGMLAGSS